MTTNVIYDGPHAEFASLTGSPFWGMSVQDVSNRWVSWGWKLLGESYPETPYGEGPLTLHFETRNGRSVIWIPSYGAKIGEDWLVDQTEHKVFWVMWQAGVKVFIVGGTSGITDFRDQDEAILPGDMVLPWSFDTSPHMRGLPGTPYQTFWPEVDVTLEDPFCTQLRDVIYTEASHYLGENGIRKIHTPKTTRVGLVVPQSITYETDFEIRRWRALNKLMSDMEPNKPPIVTLHGDCVNPILARRLGMHEAYYHLVANWAQGLGNKNIVATLYPLYVETFHRVAIPMEFSLLENMPIPDGTACNCVRGTHTAPEVFTKAMSKG
jgi:purine nucleoside phosphorylase